MFYTQKEKVFGVRKKGHIFFELRTNLAEDIRNLCVSGMEMHSTGENNYHYFKNYKVRAFLLHHPPRKPHKGDATQNANTQTLPGRVNDMVLVHMDEEKEVPILACEDRRIRILQGEQVSSEVNVKSTANVVAKNNLSSSSSSPSESSSGNQFTASERRGVVGGHEASVLYGTARGDVGEIRVTQERSRRERVLENAHGRGGVVALTSKLDLSGDGQKDLVLGREDGSIEVHSRGEEGRWERVGEMAFNESIVSLDGGTVTQPAEPQAIVHTFSGTVAAATFHPGSAGDGGISGKLRSRRRSSHSGKEDVQSLQKDIEGLKKEIEERKTRLKSIRGSATTVLQDRQVASSFALDPNQGAYAFSMEAPTPVTAVALQSEVPMSILERPDDANVVSKSAPSGSNGHSAFSVVLRLPDAAHRVSALVRMPEGKAGRLKVYALPQANPATFRELTFQVKPLCMHWRGRKEGGEDAAEEGSMPSSEEMSTAHFRGDFSAVDMHDWLEMCLPEMPGHDGVRGFHHVFRSAVLGTVLEVKCNASGEAHVSSDNPSALRLLWEWITKEATSGKIRMDTKFDLQRGSILRACELLNPLLSALLNLSRERLDLQGLRELKMQEEDLSFLAPEYASILSREEEIEAEHAQRESRLEFFTEIARHLFLDWQKLNGANPRSKLKELNHIIQRGSLHDLQSLMTRGT